MELPQLYRLIPLSSVWSNAFPDDFQILCHNWCAIILWDAWIRLNCTQNAISRQPTLSLFHVIYKNLQIIETILLFFYSEFKFHFKSVFFLLCFRFPAHFHLHRIPVSLFIYVAIFSHWRLLHASFFLCKLFIATTKLITNGRCGMVHFYLCKPFVSRLPAQICPSNEFACE